MLLGAIGFPLLGEEAPSPAKPEAPSPGAEKPANAPAYGPDCFRADCHAKLEERPAVHGPVAIMACDACHQAVAGEEHEFSQARDEDLCTFCHALPREAKVVHKPFGQKGCLFCHDPHGGASRDLLVEKEEPGGLCFECHEKKTAKLTHRPYAEGKCTQCHASHQSDLPALRRAAEPKLCDRCHEHFAKTTMGLKVLHDPVKKGQCSACHASHASEDAGLLVAFYSKELYEPFDEAKYALCFRCHEVRSLLDPQSTKTGFRDGTRNLHHLHVNRPDKGRGCVVCHPAHGSELERLVRKEVPFGSQTLAIGFTPAPDGGKCATGCHKEATYARPPRSEPREVKPEPGVPETGAKAPPAESPVPSKQEP